MKARSDSDEKRGVYGGRCLSGASPLKVKSLIIMKMYAMTNFSRRLDGVYR